MCGIAGILKKNRLSSFEENTIRGMTKSISHRGPNDSGVFVTDRVLLGHTRLSILDLSSNGHQPMSNKSKTIVFNGEIYNFKEIRSKLEKKGEKFYTNCDTEVLLYIAKMDSFDWLDDIIGMFAFAIWDDDSGKLLLGRDRFGKKPLYYCDTENEFIFSSEIRAILSCPGMNCSVDYQLITEYLTYRSISGEKTLFKNIFQIPPGHLLLIDSQNGKHSLIPYWDEKNDQSYLGLFDSKSTIEDQFNTFFADSIRKRLVSDVPVGTFNSGGVDSSLVTYHVRQQMSGELHTFSVGFNEKQYDESNYAMVVSKIAGTIHHPLYISEGDFVNSFQETVRALEEPIHHPHTTQLLLLSKYAKQFVTVVLTGEGADEVFGGYPRYQIPLIARYLKFLPGIINNALLSVAEMLELSRVSKILESAVSGHDPVVVNAKCIKNKYHKQFGMKSLDFSEKYKILEWSKQVNTNLLETMLTYDRRTYLSSLLLRLDKVSMWSALEARVPFLDHRLVLWAKKLPYNQKIKLFQDNKILLKQNAQKIYPADMIYRRKKGFDVPINIWLRNSNGFGKFLDTVLDSRAWLSKFINCNGLETIIKEHKGKSIDHSEFLWGLVCLVLWKETFNIS